MKTGNATETNNAEQTPVNVLHGLSKQPLQDHDADALLIHEQLMEQYAETFEKLAQ